MTKHKRPMAVANQISEMLNQVLGINRYPVDVQQLALEYRIEDIEAFEVDSLRRSTSTREVIGGAA